MYVYEIGRIKADPQGAAEMVPKGCNFSGAGIPPVDTFNRVNEIKSCASSPVISLFSLTIHYKNKF